MNETIFVPSWYSRRFGRYININYVYMADYCFISTDFVDFLPTFESAFFLLTFPIKGNIESFLFLKSTLTPLVPTNLFPNNNSDKGSSNKFRISLFR